VTWSYLLGGYLYALYEQGILCGELNVHEMNAQMDYYAHMGSVFTPLCHYGCGVPQIQGKSYFFKLLCQYNGGIVYSIPINLTDEFLVMVD